MGIVLNKKKLWVSEAVSEEKVCRISGKAGISRLLARVLLARGLEEEEGIKRFLSPSFECLHDPYLLNGMEQAVDRIVRAIDKKESIVIFGDYDVDGVTSTSVLYDYLCFLGARADYYIPGRLEEGYGLSFGALDAIMGRGASLLITVDCGVTSHDEIAHAVRNGMDVIVTDHHECTDTLPPACSVINPCRRDSTYPFKELAGVGVVFKLVEALCTKTGTGGKHLDYLDLVTLGTIADVVPLLDENRIIAKHGLPAIEKTGNLGLKTLVEGSGLGDKPVNSFAVSFVLAPRINAAGRLGDARRAVRLFTTRDGAEAGGIVAELNEENRRRQETETEILESAIKILESEIKPGEDRVIVLSGKGWHHGVIGIVASRITERYYRPCILFSEEEGMGKGSGRSIEGFNLFEALSRCSGLLERYGGHELAAGMSIRLENLEAFRRAINAYAKSVMTEEVLVPRLRIDAFIDRQDLTLDNVGQLDLLAPFGSGNPGPVFAYNKLKISELKTVGENKHLKLKLDCGGEKVEAIGFNMGGLADRYLCSDILDAAFNLEVNRWNSMERVQLNLRDIRLCEEINKKYDYFEALDKYIVFEGLNDYNKVNGFLELVEARGREYYGASGLVADGSLLDRLLEELIPERPELVAVFKFIRAGSEGSLVINDLFAFARRLSESCGISLNYFKLKRSIEIFEELKLFKKEPLGESGLIVSIAGNSGTKTSLEASPLYIRLQSLKGCKK